MFKQFARAIVIVLAGSLTGYAQVGLLDQSSPMSEGGPNSTEFNVNDESLIWQQQIRAGFPGLLEGVRVRLIGNEGAHIAIRVRLGDAWAEGPARFDGVATKTVSGYETIFIEMSSAGIALAVGDTFVLETQGANEGVWIVGSFVNPIFGEPLYPEPLFVDSGEYPPGWRHGFETFMLVGPPPCPGDLNDDGAVGLADLAALLAHFGVTEGAAFEDGDLSGDGDVDLQDLATLLALFGSSCP